MSPNRPLTILITGCSDGGIGSSLALAFHAHNPNHKIIATLRNPSKASALKPFSPAITIVPLDVLSAQSITSCVEQVSSLTNGKLDILLNNAGYGLTCPITDTNTDEARDLFNTNFFAVMDVTNAFLPLLLNSARDGRGPKPMIVNNTSIVGVIPMPWQGVYNASKAALASLTDTLRLELEVVGVNVVDLKTGAVKSGFFGNVAGGDQSDTGNLSHPSIYEPAEAVIAKIRSHTHLESQAMPTREYADKVVADLLANPSKPPVQIWRGANAFIVWLGRRFLPFTAMDSNMRKMGRLDEVEASLKQLAGKRA